MANYYPPSKTIFLTPFSWLESRKCDSRSCDEALHYPALVQKDKADFNGRRFYEILFKVF